MTKKIPTKVEKKLSFHEKLVDVQSNIKVPKGRLNKFSNFYYRSAEDILEGVKPLLQKHGLTLRISDEIVMVGNSEAKLGINTKELKGKLYDEAFIYGGARFYVKSVATLTDGTDTVEVEAFAREEETKKGMDGSQITGASSSYARKYALNGLFLIDDTQDADTMDNKTEVKKEQEVKSDFILANKLKRKISEAVMLDDVENLRQEVADAKVKLSEKHFMEIVEMARKKKEELKATEISDEDLMNMDFDR